MLKDDGVFPPVSRPIGFRDGEVPFLMPIKRLIWHGQERKYHFWVIDSP